LHSIVKTEEHGFLRHHGITDAMLLIDLALKTSPQTLFCSTEPYIHRQSTI